MIGKTKRKKENIILEDHDAPDKLSDSTEVTSEAVPVRSIFRGLYCQYDYNSDNSYVKWLVEDETNVCGPVITDMAHTPRNRCKLPSLKDLMMEVAIPSDLISTPGPTVDDEEDVTIL